LALLLATAALAFLPSTAAHASCPINDPDCGGPTEHTYSSTLTVNTQNVGSVTSSPAGIACPGDCTEQDDVTVPSNIRPTLGWTTYTLTASGGPAGTTPAWSGCDSEDSSHRCIVANDDETTSVALGWFDITDPTVQLTSPAEGAKVGPTVLAQATAADGAGIMKVRFEIDNVVEVTDFTAPYTANLNLSQFPSGSTHYITAQVFDNNGRTSQVNHLVTVDKSVGVTVGQIPAYISSPAQSVVTISTDPDASMECRVNSGTPTACAAPSHQFLDDATADGSYTLQVVATDDVGNIATANRSTVLDTTAPAIAITRSPTSGSVASTGSFTVHATDANLDTLTCTLDGRAVACAADVAAKATFAPGRHTFVATAHDKAGNVATASRTFTSRGRVAMRAKKKIHKRRATLRVSHLPIAATGKVVFLRGKHQLCKATVHRGTASCRTKKLHKGKYKVSVRYLGSTYYVPARITLRFKVR